MSEQKPETLEFPPLEKSINHYEMPFPRDTQVTNIEKDGPAHIGPFRGAIDYIMALGTSVVAPLDGVISDVYDRHEKYGPTDEFVNDANYITIAHANGEFSQVVHLAKDSSKVKKGDKVKAGQKIAITGNSGWMTEPHLHFFVFTLDNIREGFIGLEPQFKQETPRTNILTKLHLKKL
ncbi:MAG: hypothetical protein A2798_03300 [Candidatus Levybacteria bacterium RIFCSPHIGHO2_01_FULL_37_17]|nr:MAG: hypothetical protein A2798_03300 [Candidatus Levybacteria bacterium RIFCSPHIGHO2_01_FULL_37_17]OGH36881.1 MAG: hypothetical protein A2959_01290 [Candidatus Levybacteria bacterium RIFCSPLOWO2_01_FULL_38_23]